MISRICRALFLGFLTFWSSPLYADDFVQNTDNTTVRLFSDGESTLAVMFEINDGWHIYWSNPGEIGKPTQITANLPEKMQIINQSVPLYEKAYDIMDEYFYREKAFYLLKIQPEQNLQLTISFVECEEECKPQNLSFDLSSLPQTPLEQWLEIKSAAESTFPQKLSLTSPTNMNRLIFRLTNNAENMLVIPTENSIVTPESLHVEAQKNGTQITWMTENNQRLTSLLIMTPEENYLADISYQETPLVPLAYVLLMAFLGGLILNAMPCVFPILSLKIFSLLKHREEPEPIKNALGYTAGVVLSFMLLTGILVMLKMQGEAIGWGFQLQSPWFVGTMAVIFLILFLFMMDWLTFPSFAGSALHKLADLNAFTTGFFAVLIASPCTGPFMGAAIGYAFMRSNEEIFAVFMALALGYAIPYAMVELFPSVWVRLFPRPGRWMRQLKVILAVPVLLTSLWLFSVLATQLSFGTENKEAETGLVWKPFDAFEVAKLAAQKEKIFVDFTADWCLTCQFNDKMILQSSRFKQFVSKNNVHLYKADLTEDNDAYNDALHAYGRDGIPVYVYYKNGTYKILPLFFSVSALEED